MRVAARLTITGVVQGVGFRPYVHRLATLHALSGWVCNQSGQVEIHVEGERAALDAFSAAIPQRLPPLAHIDRMARSADAVENTSDFRIVDSRGDSLVEPDDTRDCDAGNRPDTRLPVPADVVTCDACARELFDPSNRRYHYPFTTCTDCGPRYTVIESLPYDRERTSLRAFPLCERCRQEYQSPTDRRFHAESMACPACGPHLRFAMCGAVPSLAITNDEDALRAAALLLDGGGIVALRGLGGYHLAVDATNESAVARLRARKRRDAKPLACMIRSTEDAARWASPTAAELMWLASRERPIVLMARRAHSENAEAQSVNAPQLAQGLAPGLDRIGLMLPSTPLHHLLLDLVGRPLVMTSGNTADEPLAAGNAEARHRLAHIADAILSHDRKIVARIDDSVVRLVGTAPIMVRRARGYAPLPFTVPVASPVALLAVGAQLKNTFTLVQGTQAFVSPHIGDLDTLEALTHWQCVRARYEALFRVTPVAFVADLHDGYLSTRAAEEAAQLAGMGPMLRVQHHHAHIAAVAAENGVVERVLGLAFDGTGAGTDGTVWGMEYLLADLQGFTRVAHLRPSPLPGGDTAVRAPWRSLAGFLSLDHDAFPLLPDLPADVSDIEAQVVRKQLAQSINTPLASSAGRLFDAVASLLGICHVARFEGEAAMRLEAAAGRLKGEVLPFPVSESGHGLPMLNPVPLFAALLDRQRRGIHVQQLSADFHDTLAYTAVALARRLADAHRVYTIALGGGCFQNARLLTAVFEQATASGLRVLTPHALPANDGGVSFGQAAIAAARLSADADLCFVNGATPCA